MSFIEINGACSSVRRKRALSKATGSGLKPLLFLEEYTIECTWHIHDTRGANEYFLKIFFLNMKQYLIFAYAFLQSAV